jgi:hypothetical protein
MKHIKSLFLLLLPTLLLPFMMLADQSTLGTGTFTPASPPTILDMRMADGNTFINAKQPFTVVGTLTGTEVLTFHEVIHPDGTVNIQSFGVFTGTVNGILGTVLSRNVSTGDNNSQEGHFTLFNGTDALATLHAEGTFTFVRRAHIQGRSTSTSPLTNKKAPGSVSSIAPSSFTFRLCRANDPDCS